MLVQSFGDNRHFYPRSPCGERPLPPRASAVFRRISIHALLAESDMCHSGCPPDGSYFYPRSPCGERPVGFNYFYIIKNFYPRSPCGERRVTVLGIQHRVGISIHALLAESDWGKNQVVLQYSRFLSTLSLRRATDCMEPGQAGPSISIHALLAESDG